MFLSFLLFLLVTIPYLEGYSVTGSPSCIRAFDAGNPTFDQQSIRFYNGCPQDMFIKACVTDVNNISKLFSSARYIRTNGNFTITTLPGMLPVTVDWIGSNTNPPDPGNCLAVADDASKHQKTPPDKSKDSSTEPKHWWDTHKYWWDKDKK